MTVAGGLTLQRSAQVNGLRGQVILKYTIACWKCNIDTVELECTLNGLSWHRFALSKCFWYNTLKTRRWSEIQNSDNDAAPGRYLSNVYRRVQEICGSKDAICAAVYCSRSSRLDRVCIVVNLSRIACSISTLHVRVCVQWQWRI